MAITNGASSEPPPVKPDALSRAAELVGTLLTPVAVVTALLFYFGWVRTAAIFGYFGIDQNLLGFTTNDYLLRSAGVAFRPLAVLLIIVGLLMTLARVLVLARNSDARFSRGFAGAVALLAGLSLVGGLATLFGLPSPMGPLPSAVALGIGAVGLELVASLALQTHSHLVVSTRRTLFVALALLAAFWAFAVYAQRTGERLAHAWGQDLWTRPKVLVFSKENLHLSGPGVSDDSLRGEDGFTFRYNGYRLLIYSHGRWLLLPEGWTTDGSSTAVVLFDDPGLRIEVAPGG